MGSLNEDMCVRWSDGTRRPMVVSGGSDVGTTEPSGPAPASDPPAGAPEPSSGPARQPDGRFAPSPAAGQAEGEPSFHDLAAEYEALAGSEGDTVSLPKEKIARWNDEHKRYRERWKPVEQAFQGLHEDDARDILNFVAALNDETSRPQAVKWMRDTLDRLSPAEQAKVEAAVEAAGGTLPPEADPDFDPFDQAQIDARIEAKAKALLDERDRKADEARKVTEAEEALRERAKKLGYKADATDDAYATLLFVAQRKFPYDPDPLGRAHEDIERQLSERARQYMETKRADAQNATTPPEGAAPSGHKQPKTMAEAAVSARQRIDAILDGPQS